MDKNSFLIGLVIEKPGYGSSDIDKLDITAIQMMNATEAMANVMRAHGLQGEAQSTDMVVIVDTMTTIDHSFIRGVFHRHGQIFGILRMAVSLEWIERNKNVRRISSIF